MGGIHEPQRSGEGADSVIGVQIMVEEKHKVRRLVEFKEGCKYGRFGRTLAYRLIAAGKIKAYKMGHKTMIDLNTVDAYHGSLPTAEVRRASA
jgi:excisionase family DNA binding protein